MLSSKQRSFLSKLAATENPIIMVGKEGLSPALEKAFVTEFSHRELLKVRFVSGKDERRELAASLAKTANAELVRVIGFVAVFYKQASNPEKREIQLPS